MPLISASTIITSLSLFHITLAWFFLASPATIADQTVVFIVGEAMQMPFERSFDVQSPPLAFLAAIFLVLGVSDLISISLPNEIATLHWGSQAPIRLTIFGSLAIYSYFFSETSPLNASKVYYPSSLGEGLKNRVFFTWAFLEMMLWFWAWVTLREEKREMIARIAEKRAAEGDRLESHTQVRE